MWKFLQSDSKGNPAVFEDGMQVVTQFTCPPLLPQKNIVWGHKLTTTGLPTGSDDMGIDGSATPVDFYISADPDNDTYITHISIICGYGTTGDLFVFADSGASLTNGVNISYDHPTKGVVTIANPKANYDFLRFTLKEVVPTSWQMLSFVAKNDYGFIVTLPLMMILPPYGIKLDRGTIQKLKVTIRDDCTDADLFNMRCFGFERFE